MNEVTLRVFLARVLGAIGGGCGILGVLSAVQEKTLKLGPDDWFLLGILPVVSAFTIFFDEYREVDKGDK